MKEKKLSQPLFRPTPPAHLEAGSSRVSQVSVDSATHYPHEGTGEQDNDQDILELWFAGQHGDIGGGECFSRSVRCSKVDTMVLQDGR
jgi:hypothetical protein